MSAVLPVTRIVPQGIQAIRVELGPNGQTAGVIAALLAELTLLAGYRTENNTGPEFFGGWRIKLTRANDPELVAYPNDYILVTDATYAEPGGWSLQSTSRAHVYGQSHGMSGTAANFVDAFTVAPDADNPLNWPATSTPPSLEAQSGLMAVLTFPQPLSANGPFNYRVNLTDVTAGTTAQVTPQWNKDDGVITGVISNLVEGHDYNATVDIKATKYNVTATSLVSNDITAAAEVEEPAPPLTPGPMMMRGPHVGVRPEQLSPGLQSAPIITRVNN